MLIRILLLLCFAFSASFVVAQQTTQIGALQICTPQECTETQSNITIGLELKFSNGTYLHFLPGQYSSSFLQSLGITGSISQIKIISSPGYSLASAVPPISVALQPGAVVYAQQFYTGKGNFVPLPSTFSNQNIPLPDGSIAISEKVWVAISDGTGPPTILYNTAPVIALLSSNKPFTITDIQSSTCQPPCSSFGVCTASGICSCTNGYTGSSCDECAFGFVTPACKPCASPCKTCDQITGACTTPKTSQVKRAQNACDCQNGKCNNDDNKCTCLPGWTNPKCDACAPGFYRDLTSGNCRVCQLGCADCQDVTAKCNTCYEGFSLDQTDSTKCDPSPTTTKNSTCPDASYSTGDECALCSPPCGNCNGPSPADCLSCLGGTLVYNGNCTEVNSVGICKGTNGMIANNNKKMCDTCGLGCTACEIPDYTSSSTIGDAQCTSCLSGLAPSNGKCKTVSCPKGHFVSRSSSSCEACSSLCATCAEYADICTTCPKGHFLSGTSCKQCSPSCATCSGSAEKCLTCSNRDPTGKCVSTCPEGTFSHSNTCVPCFADCAACSGPSSNQCTKCPPNRPVHDNGHCYPKCPNQNEYFDSTISSCQPCDSTCSSCFGAGSGRCLACSNPDEILKDGGCSLPGPGDFAYLGMAFYKS